MADIWGQMMDAMVGTDEPVDETMSLNLNEQKDYIGKNVNKINLETKREFIKLLILHNLKSELQDTNEGTLINLDHLSDDIVQQLYTFVQYHIEKISQ